MKHLNITVNGKVQGVYFRASTRQTAQGLGVQGWVCNRPDGSVYLEAEGSPESLERLLAWLAKGPPAARVGKVDAEEGPCSGFTGFEIRR